MRRLLLPSVPTTTPTILSGEALPVGIEFV
jgi:hypothetical protein